MIKKIKDKLKLMIGSNQEKKSNKVFKKKNKPSLNDLAQEWLEKYSDKIDLELVLSDEGDKLSIFTNKSKKASKTAKKVVKKDNE